MDFWLILLYVLVVPSLNRGALFQVFPVKVSHPGIVGGLPWKLLDVSST